MSVTTLDVVKTWADRWKTLAAWRAPLDVTVIVKPRPAHITTRLGTAWCGDRRAVIYVAGRLASDLGTALHELAHLAAPISAYHERPWREIYIAAAAEVTGHRVDSFEIDDIAIADVDAQVDDAIDAWLTTSGQRSVLKAIGALPR